MQFKNLVLAIISSFAISVQAIETKTCPETLKVTLNNFVQGSAPDVDENNPHVPYAYISLKNLNEMVVDLKLEQKVDSRCEYSGANGIFAKIEGSLKDGAKEPAFLQLLLPSSYQTFDFVYVVYARIFNLTSDKALVLDGLANVYVDGEECNGGECMQTLFRMGKATIVAHNDKDISCLSLDAAKDLLNGHLTKFSNYKDTTIERLVTSLKWEDENWEDGNNGSSDKEQPAYYTDVAHQWECAPSADCWYGYVVTCDGSVDTWNGGEE
jgi:hypothetical protein